ncbi:MAG: exodeoxyribonuclease VII large subunit [Victivallaceae bacterium]|nr:exodeoxyribonuclease VII large subunit [Victivallaceae bacterium]
MTVEERFGHVRVRGEISGFKRPASGHMYFTLKDESAVIKAVLFKGYQQNIHFKTGDGLKVIAHGNIDVFDKRGEYQIIIDLMEPEGIGDLQLAFEKLKQRLQKEGFFDESHKKKIPAFPDSIGVITSQTGAALRDILNITARRYKGIRIIIYPVLVQGDGAAEEIAAAINTANRRMEADVLIVGRGGGSIEDLWPFNEEIVSRAIYDSKIPVISAVGHEIDFTICDFVADMRVPTPSAAAELVVGRREEFEKHLQRSEKDLKSSLQFVLQEVKNRLKLASESHVFREPIHIVRQKQQYLDDLMKNLNISLERTLRNNDLRLQLVTGKLKSNSHSYFRLMHSQLDGLIGKLDALGPQNVLNRGFAILKDSETNATITDHNQVSGKELQATVSNGTIDLVVK